MEKSLKNFCSLCSYAELVVCIQWVCEIVCVMLFSSRIKRREFFMFYSVLDSIKLHFNPLWIRNEKIYVLLSVFERNLVFLSLNWELEKETIWDFNRGKKNVKKSASQTLVQSVEPLYQDHQFMFFNVSCFSNELKMPVWKIFSVRWDSAFSLHYVKKFFQNQSSPSG